MSFAPVLPMSGLTGWGFLNRTLVAQTTAFDSQTSIRRDEAYFREKIGAVNTAEQLVSDPRLLRVALGAFGLEADVNNRFFIRKVLEDGTLDPKALSNRLADKRYRDFSEAFGFGDFATPRTKLSNFADRILPDWKTRRFESAVGDRSESMRLALNARRELSRLAERSISDDAKWFTIMGNKPLRSVFETAFNLPKSFGTLDIDRQLSVLKQKAASILGSSSVGQFAQPEKTEGLIRNFMLRAEDGGAGSGSLRGAPALQLLLAATPARLR